MLFRLKHPRVFPDDVSTGTMRMETTTGNPFSSFSALQLFRNYNQLLLPSDTGPAYSYSCSTVRDVLPEDIPRSPFSPSPLLGPFLPYPQYSLDLKAGKYQAFLSAANPYGRRPRGEKKPIPDDQKDDRYYERRKRNNQAAKKSRDARKLREDQIALRATLLEHENAVLRAQLLTLREETESLRQLMLSQKSAAEVCKTESSGSEEDRRRVGNVTKI